MLEIKEHFNGKSAFQTVNHSGFPIILVLIVAHLQQRLPRHRKWELLLGLPGSFLILNPAQMHCSVYSNDIEFGLPIKPVHRTAQKSKLPTLFLHFDLIVTRTRGITLQILCSANACTFTPFLCALTFARTGNSVNHFLLKLVKSIIYSTTEQNDEKQDQ